MPWVYRCAGMWAFLVSVRACLVRCAVARSRGGALARWLFELCFNQARVYTTSHNCGQSLCYFLLLQKNFVPVWPKVLSSSRPFRRLRLQPHEPTFFGKTKWSQLRLTAIVTARKWFSHHACFFVDHRKLMLVLLQMWGRSKDYQH